MNDPSPLEAVFFAALEKGSASDRAAYLDEACAGEADLRRRVERMLNAQAQAGSFLEQPAVAPPASGETASLNTDARTSAYDTPAVVEAGTIIAGRYKLLEEIGEGGMGTVWMAEQTEPVQRRVAVKLIKPGMDSRQVVARFEAERQALALMDHPNIAKVFDGGYVGGSLREQPSDSRSESATFGRPFFVMELVKGTPITKYCDEKKLPVRERLELFADVCRAVQHAHQKGIIHRDLKPSNVMVAPYDGRAVVKVIDFGVAKAAGQKLTEATLFTGFGAVVGTPEYMSPEQAELNNADIDTRSDIYSLGVLLYELLTGTTPLTRQRVKEAALLEVLRAIREEEPPRPSTRLSSTMELPSIAAVRGLEPAKLSRLVRGELDWIVMKSLEKDRTRRYETANGLAADIERYLADEPVQACSPAVGYRLRKFARRNRRSLAAAGVLSVAVLVAAAGVGWAVRDRSAREAEVARQQAEWQAKVAGQVESIFAEVDRLEGEQKWPEALATARRAEAIVASGEADAATAESVRDRLRALAFIDRLERVRMTKTWVGGRLNSAAADREYAQTFRGYGVDVDELSVEAAIERLRAHPALVVPVAAALDEWAQFRWDAQGGQGDDAAAKRPLLIARGIDPDPLRDRVRATWRRPVAEVEDELRRIAESIDVRAEHPATLVILHGKLLRVNQAGHAVRLMRDAQRLHPDDFWANLNLAILLSKQKDYEGAVRFNTAAASVRPQATGALVNLGAALLAQKKLEEAEAVFRRALEVDPNLAMALNNLGLALADQKKLDEAIVCYHRALVLEPGHAGAHNNLGAALSRQGKHPEAIAAFRKAIELDPELANAHFNLGQKLHAQGKLDEAIAAFRRVIALEPENSDAHNSLGASLATQGKSLEAVAAFRKAIELDPKSHMAHGNLALCLNDLGRSDEAIAAFTKAIELGPKYANYHINRASSYASLAQWDKAAAGFDRWLELDPHNQAAWLSAADAHLAAGDTDRYRRTCQALLERFGKTDDPVSAERTAKACALAPGAVADFSLVETLAERAVTGTEKHVFHRFFVLAKGLTEYRAGRSREAVRWLVRFPHVVGEDHFDATAFAALAMARHRLGQTDEAQSTLAKAKAILAEKMPDPAKGRLFGANWGAWVHARVLTHEAEELLAEKNWPLK